MTSEIKVDTISEQTSANGVTIDGLTIKDGNIQGSPALVGTTPSFTIGDGGAEDTKIVFDGNALDYYIGLDDSADNLIIGSGSTVGSNSLITIDSDGDFTLDATSDIILDSDAANWRFKDGGTSILEIGKPSGAVSFYSAVSDADILFKGNDGGAAITALTIDMSAAGEATFNSRVGIKSAPDLGAGLHVKVSDSGGSVNGNYDTVVIEESGHSGIAILSGTSSAGLIGFGDSGAALRGYFAYNHSSDSIEIATAEAERMRIDGSGLIGIGNTTASSFNAGANRMVLGTGSGNNGLTIYAQNNASSSIHFADGSSGDASYRGYLQYSHSSDALILATSATEVASFHTDGIVFNEQSNDQNFRIESNGNTHALFVDAGDSRVGINTSTVNAAALHIEEASANFQVVMAKHTASSGNMFGYHAQFVNRDPDDNTSRFFAGGSDSGGNRFLVFSDGDVQNHDNSYGAISDERIKSNIVDANSQWNDIKALKVRNYKKNDDIEKYGDKAWVQIGVVAQELEASGMDKLVKSEVLWDKDDLEVKNGTANEGDIKEYKGVKYSVLYMKAIKALQEAQTRIETLETKVAALEG